MQYPSLQVPWMISLGNHDWYGGSVQPQVDYTNLDPYWTLPTNYFTFRKARDVSRFLGREGFPVVSLGGATPVRSGVVVRRFTLQMK